MAFSWLSLAICPYQPSFFISPLDSIQCPQKTDEYVFTDQPTLVCPCVGVHKRMLLLSLCKTLKHCSACLAPLTWMGCVMWGKQQYNCHFVGCCFLGLFQTAHSVIMLFPSSFFLKRPVNVQVVQPYNSTDIVTAGKNSFILSERSNFNIVVNLSRADHVIPRCVLTLFYMSTIFRGLPFSE